MEKKNLRNLFLMVFVCILLQGCAAAPLVGYIAQGAFVVGAVEDSTHVFSKKSGRVEITTVSGYENVDISNMVFSFRTREPYQRMDSFLFEAFQKEGLKTTQGPRNFDGVIEVAPKRVAGSYEIFFKGVVVRRVSTNFPNPCEEKDMATAIALKLKEHIFGEKALVSQR